MTKEDLVDLVVKRCTDLDSKAAARRAVDAVFEAIESGLQKDGEVRLTPFGSFKVKVRSARVCRNPKTGEQIKVPAKRVVQFRASGALTDKVK